MTRSVQWASSGLALDGVPGDADKVLAAFAETEPHGLRRVG